jgi:hypothetical protein
MSQKLHKRPGLIAAAPAVIIGALSLLVPDMPVDDEVLIAVTFDASRGGYIVTHPQLTAPVIALSLAVLRQRCAVALQVSIERVKLRLDKSARRQRDQRRSGGAARASDTSGQNAAG